MPQCKTILFQGDSITDGGRGRNKDLNHILGHGYAYIIASKLGHELAEKQPLFINRGVSGDRVFDLYARWNEDALSLRPDLISILVGVNDAGRIINGEHGGASDRFERAYRHLLEETYEMLPGAGIVLCEPFILNVPPISDRWEIWQERIVRYQDIVRKLADEFGAVFVPLQSTFNEACELAEPSYWIWDGVHPTTAGHGLLAKQWLSVVQQSCLRID